MTARAPAPGLRYLAVPQVAGPSPLRTDVAGFLGLTSRGPVRPGPEGGLVGVLTRVTGWRGYLTAFGGLRQDCFTPHAVQGYFDNGGEVAWICRLCPPGLAVATGLLTIPDSLASRGFAARQFQLEASSPGAWAEGGTVQLRYRRQGLSGRAEVDVVVRIGGEPVEFLPGIAPEELAPALAERSALVRAVPVGAPPAPGLLPATIGPVVRDLPLVVLGGGSDGLVPGAGALGPAGGGYRASLGVAAQAVLDEEEVALVVAPDLHADPWLDAQAREAFLGDLLRQSAALHDRLVLLESPDPGPGVEALLQQAGRYRDLAGSPEAQRAGAFYHPWLTIPSTPGSNPRRQLLELPPGGHVAGVISRLDRERGPHHTPANAPVIGAVDLSTCFDADAQGWLHPAGVNLVRCLPGRGLQVWGSRTLDLGEARDLRNGRFLAHRRLVHRLVRAARRVAAPLAFDVNGPELWLTLVRALTSVLLEAFRAGALQGERPEEAFFVRCDASTNPPEELDAGRCLCELGVAPARPMEFIVLKVALLANGALEVIE